MLRRRPITVVGGGSRRRRIDENGEMTMTMPSKRRWFRWRSRRSILIACGLTVQLYFVHRFLRLLVFISNDGDDVDRHGEQPESSTLLGAAASNITVANSALDSQMVLSTKRDDNAPQTQEQDFASFVRFYNESYDDDGHHNRRRRCRLMEEFGLRYVGCGMDGRVYEAHLECRGDGDGDGDPPSATAGGGGEVEGGEEGGSRSRRRRRGQIVRVAIKVFTRNLKARGSGPRVFVNASDDGRGRELYRRLMMPAGRENTNATTTLADEALAARLEGHFALALGTVTFAMKLLQGKRGHCAQYKMVDETTMAAEPPSREWITGNVLPLLSGRPLGEVVPGPRGLRRYELLDPSTRRGIVRDLIYIHRHMFRRGVVHCDMSLWHFHHSTSPSAEWRTSLIDFERYKYDSASDSGNRAGSRRFHALLAGQMWQLFSSIAQICDLGGVAPFDVPTNVCDGRWDPPSPGDVMPKLIAAFDNCGFDRTMTLREGDVLNDTAMAYEALAAWSGLYD